VRIFGWAADDTGPGWYRLRVPLAELSRQGHETLVSTTMPAEWLETADVIVGQRVCQPGATKRWLGLARGEYGRRPLLVFEVDDDLWNVDASNVPAHKTFRGELLDNLTMCCRAADIVTVSTEPLADVVRKINPNVVVLPNQLPPEIFAPSAQAFPTTRFTVGWTGGASHVMDMMECVDGVRQFLRRHRDVVFHNVGTMFDHVRRGIPDDQWRATPWQDEIPDYYRMLDFTVGIAPLRPSVFNQSKSELKFLEYAARGIVPVVSDYGPYARVAKEAGCGFLVTRPYEWAATLSALRRSASIVAGESGEVQQFAKTRHIEKHWQSWEAVYGS
jgi:glycosyltransferase involved in cell wall biosynthesis